LEATTATTEPSLSLPLAERLPVLAVDDRQENLVALEAVLAPLDVPVVSVSSGEEALRLLLETDFALILLDVRMPGLSGLDTAQLIKSRERSREVPIIFLTAAHDDVEDIVRGYGVGAVDYVLKPFDAGLLRSKVAVFIELERSRQALRQSEAFLRSAFEAAPIGKTVLDSSHRVVRANLAFARLVGRSQQALADTAIGELCHPADRDALAAMLDAISGDLNPSAAVGEELDVDLRLVDGNGHAIWVAPTASPIDAADSARSMLLIQWVDVGGRRRAEEVRAELMLEQAARTQAEAQADRLRRLDRLMAQIESGTLDDLLPEVARRVVRLFDADAAEVQVADASVDVTVRAIGDHVQRMSPMQGGSRFTGAEGWAEAELTASGTRIGAVRIAMLQGRPVTAAERSLLREAADRVSLVVRRVQLQQEEHRIAVELQRGLMPDKLPSVPGVAIAAHSEAAGLGAEVGGDWYDAFTLSGDRMGVVIGDVTGNGIRAASTMGQLRSVTRAFALGDPDPPTPAQVLTRLHRYHETLGLEELFTILYVIIDQADGSLVWANAGHPPPLLRSARGDVRMLSGAESMMGIRNVVYADRRLAVGEGDTLVLYTDGLVERRDETIDVGLARLADAVSGGPDEPQELCTYLLASAPVGDPPSHDDVTALVVTLTAGGARAQGGGNRPGEVEVALNPDATAPREARALIVDRFGDALAPQELDRAKLAISELVTNAVQHGRGQITLRAHLDDRRLHVDVIDEGAGFERVAGEQELERARGWGLELVEADTSRWGMQDGATHVWFEIERGA
jgi:PAS domain S-box-containing protein